MQLSVWQHQEIRRLVLFIECYRLHTYKQMHAHTLTYTESSLNYFLKCNSQASG